MNKQYRKLAKLIYKIKTKEIDVSSHNEFNRWLVIPSYYETKDDYTNALVNHLIAWFKATDLTVNQFNISGHIKGNYYRSSYVWNKSSKQA